MLINYIAVFLSQSPERMCNSANTGVLGRDIVLFTPLAVFLADECLFRLQPERESLSGIINDFHLLLLACNRVWQTGKMGAFTLSF